MAIGYEVWSFWLVRSPIVDDASDDPEAGVQTGPNWSHLVPSTRLHYKDQDTAGAWSLSDQALAPVLGQLLAT
jgi:hypothetical protein